MSDGAIITVKDVAAPLAAECERLLSEVSLRDSEIQRRDNEIQRLKTANAQKPTVTTSVNAGKFNSLLQRLVRLQPGIKTAASALTPSIDSLIELTESAITMAESFHTKHAAEGHLVGAQVQTTESPGAKRDRLGGRWA